MKINSTNNVSYNQKSFKSAYPVVHWLAEENGNYHPILNNQQNENLQGIFVKILNQSYPMIKNCSPERQIEIRKYIAGVDLDYKRTSAVRTFNDKSKQHFLKPKPISYIISGDDISLFENSYTRNNITENNNQNIQKRQGSYITKGLEFVNDPVRRITINRITQVLHTKFEIIRDKFGKISHYKLIDVRFLPEIGINNPLERYLRNLH